MASKCVGAVVTLTYLLQATQFFDKLLFNHSSDSKCSSGAFYHQIDWWVLPIHYVIQYHCIRRVCYRLLFIPFNFSICFVVSACHDAYFVLCRIIKAHYQIGLSHEQFLNKCHKICMKVTHRNILRNIRRSIYVRKLV